MLISRKGRTQQTRGTRRGEEWCNSCGSVSQLFKRLKLQKRLKIAIENARQRHAAGGNTVPAQQQLQAHAAGAGQWLLPRLTRCRQGSYQLASWRQDLASAAAALCAPTTAILQGAPPPPAAAAAAVLAPHQLPPGPAAAAADVAPTAASCASAASTCLRAASSSICCR